MIDEKKLIELCKELKEKETGAFSKGYNKALRDIISTVKSDSFPKMEWIPVSERLPEPEREVLLQFENNMVVGFYFFKNGNLDGTTKWYGLEDDDSYTFCDAQPIAWMPLPEPYKGE